MKRIVILTGSELRHQFFCKLIAATPGIEVLRSYCEGTDKALMTLAKVKAVGSAELELEHLRARTQSEEDYFRLFVNYGKDHSNPLSIAKGAVNDPDVCQEITALEPDLLVAYGCSIVKDPLLGRFVPRFLNVHLGLSPYYRGSGTNFWPFVNGELEFCGITFMYIDAGIDTGEIIHQIRPRIFPDDTIHSIGNRLIGDMAQVYAQIILKYDELEKVPKLPTPEMVKVYKRSDFTDASVKQLYAEMSGGLVKRYLIEKDERCRIVPIVTNSAIGHLES